MLNRREFLSAASVSLALAQDPPNWGGPVIDIHFHMRVDPAANWDHLAGAGISHAILLTRGSVSTAVPKVQAAHPGRFHWSASADITKPEAEQTLRDAVKAGAIGFGEIKPKVNADGPELRRMYALAGELGVPILVHFQEFEHYANEGNFSVGFKNFAAMLKAYPKTKFVGHADAVWANISADYREERAYPPGKIKAGGITDKLLADYPNFYADMSANSGYNALFRDPEFMPGFIKRHQDKLMYGSDCPCPDGKGTGVSMARNPEAKRMEGRCVARESLTLIKKYTDAKVFRKVTWENAHRIYGLKA